MKKSIFEIDNITLDDKREVKILSINKWLTYKNLLCGIPTKEINESILEDSLTHANKNFEEVDEVFLVKPLQSKIELPIEISYGEPYKLPKVTCIAELSYMELINDNKIKNIEEHDILDFNDVKFKKIILIWFQKNFDFHVDELFLAELRKVFSKRAN